MLKWSVAQATSQTRPSARLPSRPQLESSALPPTSAADLHIAFPTLTLSPSLVTSHQQAVVRAAIVDVANSCMASSKATSTNVVYNGILDKIIPPAESGSGIRLLPCETDEQFIVLFSHLLITSTLGSGPVNSNGEKSIRWSYVRSARAALAAWHDSRGVSCVLDSWSPRMCSFWEGLKRRAVHTVTNKTPMSLDTVRELLLAGASAWSQIKEMSPSSFSDAKALLIDLRAAASVAISFFGIRRAAEVSSIVLGDVKFDESSNSMIIRVKQQKNDQLGRGQDAIIPAFPKWGAACPVATIKSWLLARAMISAKWDENSRICSAEPRDPTKASLCRPWLLLTLSGPTWGGRLKPDALRESFKRKCARDAPCPSPRKGGVRFLRTMGVDRRVIQVQGGWKSEAVMESIYDGFGHHEVAAAMNAAAHSAQLIDSASTALAHWDALSDHPERGRSSRGRLWLISRISSALPAITGALITRYGPRARSNISNALRSWDVPHEAKSNLSKALVELRLIERKNLDFESRVNSSVALAADLRRPKRSRSPEESVE